MEGVLGVQSFNPRRRVGGFDLLLSRLALANDELDSALVAGRVADGRVDQPEEVPLDPLAREVVRYAKRERLIREVETFGVREPRPVRRFVERAPQSLRNLGPQVLCCQQLLARHAG